VKQNQPTLLASIAEAFNDSDTSPRQRRLAESERQTARQVNKAHGRRECRELISTTALNDYLDWPAVGQCFKLTRQRTSHGTTQSQTVFGITSLTPQQADAERLLALTRQHWMIENGVFHVRDVTMGEDACRVRSGSAPQILSTLRNAVLNLLNRAAVTNKAAALRRHAAHPFEALTMIRPDD
jgi:predicted transposase YbfD/YdcC